MNSLEAAVRMTEAAIGKINEAKLGAILAHPGSSVSTEEFTALGEDIGALFKAIHGAVLKSPD